MPMKKSVFAMVVHRPVYLLPTKLNLAKYNPRKISEEDFKSLQESMSIYGFIDPVVVQKKAKIIVGGHQRVKAIIALCTLKGVEIPRIPCIVLDIGDREAKKLNILLNNLHGEFDARMLGHVLAEMQKETPFAAEEITLMGFDTQDVDKYLRLVDAPPLLPPPREDMQEFATSVTLSLQFNDVRQRDAVKKVIAQKAETTKQKTGDFIAQLLGCS